MRVEYLSHDCLLGDDHLDALTQPVVVDTQRGAALRLGDRRVLALMQTLCLFALSPTGFRHRDVRPHITQLLGRHADQYAPGHMTYDLRRLRLHRLIAGLVKPREVEHDSQIYHAYLLEAERLGEREARIERVALDYELKREYQQWLHERDHDREDYDGHPDRDQREIEDWAKDHDLPYFDEKVHFPDLRIEYEEIDGRRDHEDVEVTTIHYRGAHGAAAARSGFSCYGGSSARISGRGGGGGRVGGRTGAGLAEELWD